MNRMAIEKGEARVVARVTARVGNSFQSNALVEE